MSNAVVGALRVTLGLDSAQFTAGLKGAQTGLQKFAGIAKAGALAVGTAMIAAGAAVGVAMKGMIDEADKMSKMADSIGIPIEELSKLRYAAQLADVDLDKLEKSVRRLAAGMLDSTESATGPAARAFMMLGVAVEDTEGKLKPISTVLADLSDRFAKMPAGPEKTALAMRIFGKSGTDLIPLLNEGSEGLKRMYEEAEELGLVLDAQTGKAAERFNDNLTRLGKVKDGIVTKITASMLPALSNLTDAMVVASKNSKLMEGAGRTLGWVVKALATAAVTAGGAFVFLAETIATAGRTAAAWASGNMTAVVAVAQHGDKRLQGIIETTREINRAIWAPPSGGLDTPPAADAFETIEQAADGTRRSVERLTDAQREAQRAAEELAREGAQVFEQTRTPAEKYASEIERLTRLLNAAAISQDTFNRAMAEAKDRFEQDDPLTQARQSIEEKGRQFRQDSAEDRMALAADHRASMEDATYDGIRSGLEAAADGNLGEYLASRIRDALFDRLAGSLTNILMGDPKKSGSGVFGSLGSFGSSLGDAFKMFTSGFPGLATGGSFKVGGSPGKDANFVGMNLTKGEMVDVRKPGQDMGGSSVVMVQPSPYFDVRVEKVASPQAAQAGMQSAAFSRQAVPADEARRRRFTLARG